MKVLGVAAGLLIAIGVTYLLYMLLGNPGGHKMPSTNAWPTSSSGLAEAPQPSRPLYVPRTREEKVREKLAEERLPYFRYLRRNYAGIIEQFAVRERLDTLDLVIAHDDDETLRALIHSAIAPSAKLYGFRKVRFFTRKSEPAVEPLLLIAEATRDDGREWNIFRK